jgi:hypothetical protein
MSESFKPFSESDTQRTGWSFECVTASKGSEKPGRGGLVLKNVRHNGHNYAFEIRVIGLRLEYDEITKISIFGGKDATSSHSRFLELGDADFEVSNIIELRNFDVVRNYYAGSISTPKKLEESRRAINFQHFPFFFGLEVNYILTKDAFARLFGEDETNVNIIGLELTQTILFSPYESKPSHEPTGGIMAARIHPLITTKFISNDNFDTNAEKAIMISSVRYDYYIYKNLDQFNRDAHSGGKVIDYGQSAAIFKDAEEIMDVAAVFGMLDRGTGGAAERALFLAAEKPLVMEICAKGLEEGYPTVIDPKNKTKRIGTWDNVHWWGSGESLEYLITAPGAFHASHLHWRWGNVVNTLPAFLIDGSGKQYQGGLPPELIKNATNQNEYGQDKRGALVDPKCWKQTIEFAVVYYKDEREPTNDEIALEKLCMEKFSDLFTKEPCIAIPKGEKNRTGGDLILWFSIKVYQQTRGSNEYGQNDLSHNGLSQKQAVSSLNGSVFIHGIFFAHDPDPWITLVEPGVRVDLNPDPRLGSTKPLHFPNSKPAILDDREWERY